MVVDSKKQQLTVGQIIDIASKETKSKYKPDQIKTAILSEFSIPNSWKPVIGNTLFIVHNSNRPHYGFFRALNADIGKNYVQNSELFCKQAYQKNFDVLVTQFEDQTILNIFKAISRNPPNPKMGYAVQKTKSGGFQVTLVLGPSRGNQ